MALVCSALIVGCSSNPRFMSPKVEAALGDSILQSIRDVQAYTYWSRSFGHGLKIEVRAPGDPDRYSRDLELETNGAALVCAAIAKSELGIRWEFVEVQYHIEYGSMPPRSRMIVGVAEVLIQRETMRILSEKHSPASEFAQSWKFLRGYKDQPDSNELLKW